MTVATLVLQIGFFALFEGHSNDTKDLIDSLRGLGVRVNTSGTGPNLVIDVIAFNGREFDCATMQQLTRNLNKANARCVNVTATYLDTMAYQAISKMPDLEELGLAVIDFHDVDLAIFKQAKKLRLLRATATSLSSIAGLKEHTGLVELHIADNKLGDRGLKELASLPSLQKLTLSSNDLTDESVTEILKCKKLKWLDIHNVPFTPAGIAKLAAIEGLEELDLSWSKVTDKIFRQLCSNNRLRRIRIDYTDVSDKVIQEVRKERPSLEIIKVHPSRQ